MSAVAAAICSSVGGSDSRWRSVIRTDPMSRLIRWVGASVPSTSSVEPPPMSTTRRGPAGRSRRVVTAPRKDSSASSSPLITSGSTPRISRIPEMNSSRLLASRVAEVAVKRRRSALWCSIRRA